MRIAVTIIALFSVASSFSQSIGNEWIDYSAHYLKVPIVNKGVYRISQSQFANALSNIGLNATSVDPRNIQVFREGAEIPIFFEGDSDGSFDPADFLLFYGEGNDGSFDSLLYPSGRHPKPYYSLFNDTSTYFISWSGNTGKRLEILSYTGPNGRTAEPFFWKEEILDFHANYQYGERNIYGSQDPEYTEGEGYFDGNLGSFGYLGNVTKYVPSSMTYTAQPSLQADFSTALVGTSRTKHITEIKYGSTQKTGANLSYSQFDLVRSQFKMAVSDLGPSTTAIRFESKALPTPPPDNIERAAIGHIRMLYPHQANLNNQSFMELVVDANSDTSFFELSSASGTFTWVFDLENEKTLEVQQSGNIIRFLVPPGPKRTLVAHSSAVIQNVGSLKAVGTNGLFTDYASFQTSEAYLLVCPQALYNGAADYAAYRLSKGYSPLIATIEVLYDQFAYGINKHPLAIRNFARLAINEFPSPPTQLFLIGKAVNALISRFKASNYYDNKLPSFGFPACDNLFTAGLIGTTYEAAVPTGRLVARSNQDIADYLDKVKTYEQQIENFTDQIDDRLWMKRILHFAGGTSDQEQELFASYLRNHRLIAEDTLYGGQITTFVKTSSAAVQTQISDSVKILIDGGTNLLQFFGHGAGGQLGFSIGDPGLYDNYGKYPLFIANSCNVGDLHNEETGTRTLNEEFVLAKDKGAIAFLSSVDQGYANYLHEYTTSFYRNFSKNLYGATLGELIQKTVRDIQRPNALVKWTCLEINLHGDPALKLNSQPRADLAIDERSAKLFPEQISVDLSSFDLELTVYNLGRATAQSF